MSKLITVVVPCYNEQESIPLFYEEMNKVAFEVQRQYGVDFETKWLEYENVERIVGSTKWSF